MRSILYKVDMMIIQRMSNSTLGREAKREPLGISAVIINHVVSPHPLELLVASRVQLLGQPRIVLGRAAARGGSVERPNAGPVGVEVSVGGGERSLGPIGLHLASPCGPVVGVP